MLNSAYLPKLYIQSFDSILSNRILKHFSNLGVSVYQYNNDLDILTNARYFLLDLRTYERYPNLDVLLETLTNRKVKTTVILPLYIANSESTGYTKTIEGILKRNFIVVFTGPIIDIHTQNETFNNVLCSNFGITKAVSIESFVELLQKCFFSTVFCGKSIEIGNSLRLGETDHCYSYVKSSDLVPNVHYIPESKISSSELKNLLEKSNILLPSNFIESDHSNENFYTGKSVVDSKITKAEVEMETINNPNILTQMLAKQFEKNEHKKQHSQHAFLSYKVKILTRWLLLSLFVLLVLPFTHIGLTYLSAVIYEYSKNEKVEIVYKNLAVSGSFLANFYSRIPYFKEQYVPIQQKYHFFNKHINLRQQEVVLKRKFIDSIKDQSIDPILFEMYVDELSLYERNIKFIMADMVGVNRFNETSLSPLFDLTLSRVHFISLLKNISYDISKSIKGESRSKIAIVIADDKKPLGYGAEITKIVVVDMPYDPNSVIVWEGSDIAENTVKDAKIESPYTLSKYSENSSWYLSYAMWNLSYDESFSMLSKLIFEKEKITLNEIRHILYVDKTFIDSIGLDTSDTRSIYTSINSLVNSKDVNDILIKNYQRKHIMFWSKDENLVNEVKNTVPVINSFTCEVCHMDMFGLYESFNSEKKLSSQKISVTISFEEGIVKHKLTYPIEQISIPGMIRVLIPQSASSSVVFIKSGEGLRSVFPVVEASGIGKSIVIDQEEIKKGDTEVVFSWESKRDIHDGIGKYQLILKHQPGSLLEYELNITGLPIEPSLTDGFVLTDEGNYTYNTLLSGDRLLEIEFDSK